MLTFLFFYIKWYREPYIQVWHFFPILWNVVIFSYFKGVCLFTVALLPWCGVFCLQLPGYPDVVLSVYSCIVTLMWCCLFTVAWLPWCGVVCLQLHGYHDVVLSVYSCLVTLMWYCLFTVAWLPWCGIVCLQ